MARLFVRHQVKDYATWRKGYDAFDVMRKKMGTTGHGVYRAVDDENDITSGTTLHPSPKPGR